jgi:hypothetical protein
VVLVDFRPHREEWLREEEGDVWLGLEPAAVRGWCQRAGFKDVLVDEGPPPARSGRRDKPGADRRLKRLGLLWVEAIKTGNSQQTSDHESVSRNTNKNRGVRNGKGKL